jgi:hypothetical protein
MLARTETMLRQADANFDASFEPSPNLYQYFEASPNQLVVGAWRLCQCLVPVAGP